MVKHSNNILNNMKRGIKTFIHSILLMTVCLVLQACPEFGDTDPIGTVYIVNKSNETIFVGASQLLEAGDFVLLMVTLPNNYLYRRLINLSYFGVLNTK